MSRPVMSLSQMSNGAVEELYQEALDKVLQNIEDPNTDHKAKRVISLQMIITADEERKVGNVTINCSTKLAGVKGVRMGVYFGRHQGRLAIVEAPKQEDLFTQPKGGPRPVEAVGAGAGGDS